MQDLHETADGDVIVCGDFDWISGGLVGAKKIARWDGSQWHRFGNGINDEVLCIVSLPNGEAIIGGNFVHVGGMPASGIAKKSNTGWSTLGTGMNKGIRDS